MGKQRLSFVTNSSSSSFILAVKDEGFLSSGASSLEKLVKKLLFDDAREFRTKEDLDEYFADNYMYGTDDLQEFLAENEWERERYNEWLDYINHGYIIVDRTVDYSEETLSQLLQEIPDGENIIMIEEG
jgi:hypothetical protein